MMRTSKLSSPARPAIEGKENGEGRKPATARLARMAVLILGAVALAYFARSVVVPVLLAWIGSMVLALPMRWLGQWHVPKYGGALLLVSLLVLTVGYGAYQLGRPAVNWANSAPENLPVLREEERGNGALSGQSARSVTPRPAVSVGFGQVAGKAMA